MQKAEREAPRKHILVSNGNSIKDKNEKGNKISNEKNNENEKQSNIVVVYPKKDDISETRGKLILKKPSLKNECMICISKESEVIFSPCGHKCICIDCYKDPKHQLKTCPYCRRNILSAVEKVFTSPTLRVLPLLTKDL